MTAVGGKYDPSSSDGGGDDDDDVMSSDCNRGGHRLRPPWTVQCCRSAAKVSLLAASHFRELRAKCLRRQSRGGPSASVRPSGRPPAPSTRSGDRTCRSAGPPPAALAGREGGAADAPGGRRTGCVSEPLGEEAIAQNPKLGSPTDACSTWWGREGGREAGRQGVAVSAARTAVDGDEGGG